MGGYKIINLKNTDFTVGTAKTVSGVYDAIEANYRKPLVLANIQIGSVEYADRYVAMDVDNTNFVGLFSIGDDSYKITITSADSITIASV